MTEDSNGSGRTPDAQSEDGFWLYDLKVETVLDGRTPVCRHIEGESFKVEGEALVFEEGQRVSMYALAAVLPLLPAKQRPTAPEDWMSTDAEVACPDPHCGGRFKITRTGKRWFSHAETTGLPDKRSTPYWQKDGAE
ncbi:TIGR04076 family protein [Roseibium sp. MMSF_3544]|uniref:TIGR04076 family protein n=1 Tax=unclassified Roseibium TaxID=2629323 RepID=UPI00273D0B9C|nr:TIGR04076 family protein [Roseibium sp. MMSF_3544]